MNLKSLICIKTYIKNFYIYLLIFLLGLGLRLFVLSIPPDLHVDEPNSFIIITAANQLDKNLKFKKSWNELKFKYEKEYIAKDIQDALFVDKKTISSYIKDFNTIRNHNIDRQHPTLYYNILKLWNLSLGEFNPKKYINHARNLNLIFYVISFFFMFKLLSLIKNDKVFISLGLLFTSCNTATIMLDTMAREYSVMTAMIITTTYISYIIGKKIIDNKNIETKMLFIYPIGYSLLLLSGYYALVYAAIVLSVLLFMCCYYKRLNILWQLGVIILISLVYTLLFYPSYFNFQYKNEHFNLVKNNLLTLLTQSKLDLKTNNLIKNLYRYVYTKTICISIVSLAILYCIFPIRKLLFENKKVSKNELISILTIFGCAIFWGVLVNYTGPYPYYSRYILPVASLYYLIVVLFLYYIRPSILLIITTIFIFSGLMQISNRSIIDIDRIIYTDSANRPTDIFTQLPENLPVIIVNSYAYPIEHLMFTNIVYGGNNIIRFEHNLPGNDFKYKKFILICNRNLIKNERPLFYLRGDDGVYIKNLNH